MFKMYIILYKILNMKKYLVTIVLIIGYYDQEYNEPKLRNVEYEVTANSESEAKTEAKWNLDKSSFSVWEIYTELI